MASIGTKHLGEGFYLAVIEEGGHTIAEALVGPCETGEEAARVMAEMCGGALGKRVAAPAEASAPAVNCPSPRALQ